MTPFLAGLITGACVTGVGGFFALALCAAARRADDDGARAVELLRERRAGVDVIRLHEWSEHPGRTEWTRN